MRKKQGKGSVGLHRVGLAVFGSLFVLLFVGFAVAQGITSPSVPAGDVAHVSGMPDEFSNISQEELKASIQRQDSSGSKQLKPGSKKYEEAQEKAMTELLQGVWIRGQAEEMGLSVTKKQIEDELKAVKKESFPTPASYKAFLKKSHFTQEEVDRLIELQILSKEIQEGVVNEAPKPSSSEVKAYYEAEKATQFTTKPSRDARIILNKDKTKVEAAKKALEADDSDASWKKVAKKYSTDPSSNAKGGLQTGLTEDLLASAPPLKKAVFGSAPNELVGPTKYQGNYVLVAVVKETPEKEQTFAEAKPQIESSLAQLIQQESFTEFVADFGDKWQQRTTCADGFVMKQCSNYKGDGRPTGADPACYEADPKTPASECPAPVTAISPAMPGTVTVAQPKGTQRAQRPAPPGNSSVPITAAPEG